MHIIYDIYEMCTYNIVLYILYIKYVYIIYIIYMLCIYVYVMYIFSPPRTWYCVSLNRAQIKVVVFFNLKVSAFCCQKTERNSHF